ncbi:MAG: HEAT repeat domain-containing protein, partial [Planctomycetota bacterium]
MNRALTRSCALLLFSASVTQLAQQPARNVNKTPLDVLEGISALVRKCVDEKEPIEVSKLIGLVRDAKAMATDLDENDRAKVIGDLGRILVYGRRKIKIRLVDGQRRGMDPRSTLQQKIIDLFGALEDKRALPHLVQYIRLYGHTAAEARRSAVSALIERLGGTVPVPIEVEKAKKAELARRLGNWVETRRLIVRLKTEKLDAAETSKIILRLGEVGDRRAVEPVINELTAKDAHWIVRQNALGTLGRLGGRRAQSLLVAELARPMPAGAKLEDYGEVEAILRSYAASGLGTSGDETVIELLEKLASDAKQYVRVREACRYALGRARDRAAAEPSAASQPASPASARVGAAAPSDTRWARVITNPKDRGTLQDAYEAVYGKRSVKDQLQHAPPLERKGQDRGFGEWFDVVMKTNFRLTPDEDNWLLFRSRQLDMYDQMWIDRIERNGDRITVAARRAIWLGKYTKNVTFHP